MHDNNEALENEIYRELFNSVVHIVKIIKKRGFMGAFDEDKIITKFKSSRKLLLLMLKLLRDASNYPTFDFSINLEFTKLIKNSSDEIELTELVLTRELVNYVYKADLDAITELVNHVGTSVLRNELTPVSNWADL